jgi:hypothetical protein
MSEFSPVDVTDEEVQALAELEQTPAFRDVWVPLIRRWDAYITTKLRRQSAMRADHETDDYLRGHLAAITFLLAWPPALVQAYAERCAANEVPTPVSDPPLAPEPWHRYGAEE